MATYAFGPTTAKNYSSVTLETCLRPVNVVEALQKCTVLNAE